MIQWNSIYSSTANQPTKPTNQPTTQPTNEATNQRRRRANKPTELSKSDLVLSSHLTCLNLSHLIPIEKGPWWQPWPRWTTKRPWCASATPRSATRGAAAPSGPRSTGRFLRRAPATPPTERARWWRPAWREENKDGRLWYCLVS